MSSASEFPGLVDSEVVKAMGLTAGRLAAKVTRDPLGGEEG